MLFAVFGASVEPQEHDANQPTPSGTTEKVLVDCFSQSEGVETS
jgi:hypothetical protein